MIIQNDVKLDYSDVLLKPSRSTLKSRSDVILERKFNFVNYIPSESAIYDDNHYDGIPIMAANMDGVGTMEMADTLSKKGIFTCLVKTYSEEELIDFFYGDGLYRTDYVAMSIGTSAADYRKLCNVYEKCNDNLKYLCIDVANGYSEFFIDYVKNVRNNFPELVIIAGNVVTGEMTQQLIIAGADIVKVGIGPGQFCKTRKITGVGYPQLSAVIECADAAHGMGAHIIADGGCSNPSDVAKAFAAGADFVMLGTMLAGHDEGGGEVVTKYFNPNNEYFYKKNDSTYHPVIEQKKFVQFYGMSSKKANDTHFGGLKEYRASEGYEGLVPYRGKVSDTVQEILGGLRSTCTYCGAEYLKDLNTRATFIRVSQQHNGGYKE